MKIRLKKAIAEARWYLSMEAGQHTQAAVAENILQELVDANAIKSERVQRSPERDYRFFCYVAWCLDNEKNMKNSRADYAAFSKLADGRHDGDCTSKSPLCCRCAMVRYEIDAQNILDLIVDVLGADAT